MSIEIDWNKEWEAHAPDFFDGAAHINVGKEEVRLLPGPGFGDSAHPTTKLMLELLTPRVKNQVVFDIGCGSGILSVSAAKLGASSVHCCDVDPLAMEHTQKNAQFNQVKLCLSKPIRKDPVVLMNMISSEQESAWKTHKCEFSILITSGILVSQYSEYLEFAEKNGWQMLEMHEKAGWLGFIFKENL